MRLHRIKSSTTVRKTQEQINEQLRQVGLAQGIVQFARYVRDHDGLTDSLTCEDRDFSDGAAVDSIDTEKSRIVLHNLEANWWLLAVGGMSQAIKCHS